jgi:hypothetical protein
MRTIALGSLSISRLLLGGNPISGFSHQTAERSSAMVDYFTVARIKRLLNACERAGITGIVARADAFIMRVLHEYWSDGGQIRWIAQTAPEYRDARQNIALAHAHGASAIYVHGGEVDRMMAEGEADTIRALVGSIRELGLPAGVAAHDPANHRDIQRLGIPVSFHMVCMYNLTGYRGNAQRTPTERFDPEDRGKALDILSELERPAILYKLYGAGRLTPEKAFGDIAERVRPCDGVCVGMYPPDAADMIERNVLLAAHLP